MAEYILFDESLRDRFTDHVRELGLSCEVRPDPIAGYVISVPDDLPEESEDALEEEYDALMLQQQEMVESDAGSADRTLMAVEVELADGRQLSVGLPAAYARRLHEHFTVDEIRALVAAIAEGVANPQSGPLCCRSYG
ncbi:MAG: hypothetical protein RBS28_11715 [Rhodocyclaceae bacterium]|jgi:hypothetical protein|nr:hypothetical protein [Rhodocyclaceae bacterium]